MIIHLMVVYYCFNHKKKNQTHPGHWCRALAEPLAVSQALSAAVSATTSTETSGGRTSVPVEKKLWHKKGHADG